ncbi:VanZ family protein [Neobacillus niacini]|uniref:VanZ family protein n=1 Tax=Neobacillus niacini TaxID=86668 RepID=UPI00285D218D|nr:VanZ family protein [Neobacillus niacini]MDR6999337.1 VanZ family protein [Neobacillus niacini]
MKFFKWVLRVLPALYMAAIWIQSSFSSDHFVRLPEEGLDNTIKESLHLVEFAILYVLLVLAFLSWRAGLGARLNVACAVFAALYGISDEIHQSFNPARSASLFDIFKDFVGISVCFYFVHGALFKGKFAGLRRMLGLVGA